MENGQHTKTASGSGNPGDTLGDLTSLQPQENTESDASRNSPKPTTATIPIGSSRTWNSAELQALQSKAGLVAGALADFQGAKGMVVYEKITYKLPSGRTFSAVKLLLFADGLNLVAEETGDGLNLVAVQEGQDHGTE